MPINQLGSSLSSPPKMFGVQKLEFFFLFFFRVGRHWWCIHATRKTETREGRKVRREFFRVGMLRHSSKHELLSPYRLG